MTTENFKTLFTYNTLFSADSVEWCPISPYQNHFVCGTYQQVEETPPNSSKGSTRRGTVLLFAVTKNELKKKSIIDTGAILDMKWCPKTLCNNIALAVANGDGEVSVYYLSDENLKFVTNISLKQGNGDYLMLSLDWSKDVYDMICCSDSHGNVAVLKFENDKLLKLRQWKAHSLEAWITCFDSFNPEIIFTGGDDMNLNMWDLRSEKPNKVISSNKHKAGVTVLNSHPSSEYCLGSGSYDETILLWDTRNWKEPTHDVTVGGGMWRLKWKPEEPRYILAACIYGGFEIIDPFKGLCIGRYKEHESLAYGADWCYLVQTDFFGRGQNLLATCSFYDQKLCVSLWDENISIFDGF